MILGNSPRIIMSLKNGSLSSYDPNAKTSWKVGLVLLCLAIGAWFWLTRDGANPPRQQAMKQTPALSNEDFINLAQIRLRREGHRYATGDVHRDGNAVVIEGLTKDTMRYRVLFHQTGEFVVLEIKP